jgi:hypothetical protein
MNETIEANLKERAIAKTKVPKNPEIVFPTCRSIYFLGNGALIIVIVMSEF